MMTIELKLVRNDSGTNLFTFIDEETKETLLSKSFDIDEIYNIDVREDFINFIIEHDGNYDFDFTSGSI